MCRDINKETMMQLKNMQKNLLLFRLAKGWSIQELSRISKINEKILFDIENGNDFNIEFLLTLCRLYKIKPHQIFSEKLDPHYRQILCETPPKNIKVP
jgi:transcriptional regulator with XRE-family HTH domain